jgi:glycosyltransferase involved in cell wall biosynthesis
MAETVLFLLPYPLHKAPSQRFRVEAFFSLLEKNDISYKTDVFFTSKAWAVLYKKGSFFYKVLAVVLGFLKRFITVLFAFKHKYIFIHREAAPLGPPVFEWLLTKVHRRKVIFDFDDAIWIPNVSENNKIALAIKCFWKVKWICQWAHKVSVGNDFLANYAKKYNSKVIYNPTCVDTEYRYNKSANQKQNPITIGWTGSHSTLPFLNMMLPVLRNLEQSHTFRFLVICDHKPDFDLRSFTFKLWNKDTEIEDLSKINIGIMPLTNDLWSEGKCGFKIIQYMALGIPAVASPVGVNKKIIDQGVNGYICEDDEQWLKYLSALIADEKLRIVLGKNGKEKIKKEYSIASNSNTFLSLFQNN